MLGAIVKSLEKLKMFVAWPVDEVGSLSLPGPGQGSGRGAINPRAEQPPEDDMRTLCWRTHSEGMKMFFLPSIPWK